MEIIFLQVEHCIFKVPCFQFARHSQLFATVFTLPRPAGEEAEGWHEGSPIKLDGVSILDFERLLKVLYPLTPVPNTPTLDADEWMSVLKLATKWHFLQVRDLAIRQLGEHALSLSPVSRIVLGRQYDVSTWLRSGYIELARRKASITTEEATKIGLEVALEIFRLRETAMHSTRDLNPYEKIELGSLFEAEFKRADSACQPVPP
ncbi:hypothetical protein GGX14DRAFT_59485, partial [Mycena pura]